MSEASVIGYGKMAPLSNINGRYVNVDNSNNPATFGTNTIPGLPGLAGAKNNVDAAAGIVPGICLFKGGRGKRTKLIKRKIKNITKQYKRMKGGKKSIRSMKKRIRSRISKKSRRTRSKRSSRRQRQRGGYAQYQNNLPMTPSYSVGGLLAASNLGLANPPPITRLPNCVNCVDNYNHYTGKGFQSKGH
jgi:hypothetical protein